MFDYKETKVENIHVCPHCGGALDSLGVLEVVARSQAEEKEAAERRALHEKAESLYEPYKNENTFIGKLLFGKCTEYKDSRLLIQVVLVLSVVAILNKFVPDRNPNMIAVFMASGCFLLFGLPYYLLKKSWKRYWARREVFKKEHPNEAAILWPFS